MMCKLIGSIQTKFTGLLGKGSNFPMEKVRRIVVQPNSYGVLYHMSHTWSIHQFQEDTSSSSSGIIHGACILVWIVSMLAKT